jgi:hypothetical protein
MRESLPVVTATGSAKPSFDVDPPVTTDSSTVPTLRSRARPVIAQRYVTLAAAGCVGHWSGFAGDRIEGVHVGWHAAVATATSATPSVRSRVPLIPAVHARIDIPCT